MRKKFLYVLIFILAPAVIFSSNAVAGPDVSTEQQGPSVPRPETDSVVWENLALPFDTPKPGAMDREWPGERMGLVGPIVAEGGVGWNGYYVVYDATGALVGGIMKEEAKEHPEYLLALILAAHDRSQPTIRQAGQGGREARGGDAK